jgi:hypothetical protein
VIASGSPDNPSQQQIRMSRCPPVAQLDEH